MSINVTWQAAGVFVALALAWSGFLVKIIQWLLTRAIHDIEIQVKHATDTAHTAVAGLQQHREACLKFQGSLPIDYYRREDMIRFETLTHAKLDGLATELKTLECRKCSHKDQ